jgi:hypothetical protein
VISFAAKCAADTIDQLAAEKALAKTGTGSVATSTESTRWEVINPDSSNKPQGGLTSNHIERTVIDLEDRTEPFDDGLFRVVIHNKASYSYRREVQANGLSFEDYSKYRQAGISVPAEYAQRKLGVFAGALHIITSNPKHVISSGAHGGGDAYKTLVMGKDYLGAAWVPLQHLPWDGEGQRIPLTPFCELRISPTQSDSHHRGDTVVYYLVGAYFVIDKNRGFYWIHRSDYKRPGT